MAFDPQNYAPFYDAIDFVAIEANYLSGSLLAGAAACIANDISEWEDHGAMPSDEVFREVEPFYDNEEPTDSETAATFLLLVREAVRY
ncbi:hypothetical protein SRS16CHR_02947 [Variovorax sp. SRS16]|uniref:hypothetical protein n=1 Tax=Variovorax sp. SRS16 TaxID=282217 RepID=UPI0013188EC7|nr:hypothetical protein [Variovorax sp. SRS16]VTU21943.1 hypothetical protein SRS16CHR_02947 [Variovorax sp. SRS16]